MAKTVKANAKSLFGDFNKNDIKKEPKPKDTSKSPDKMPTEKMSESIMEIPEPFEKPVSTEVSLNTIEKISTSEETKVSEEKEIPEEIKVSEEIKEAPIKQQSSKKKKVVKEAEGVIRQSVSLTKEASDIASIGRIFYGGNYSKYIISLIMKDYKENKEKYDAIKKAMDLK